MPAVTSAQQAIKIAREVIEEAGYEKFKITSVDFDDDDEIWMVDAEADDTSIDLTIDAANGEVTEFNTG